MSVTDPRHVCYQGRSSFLLNKLRKFYFEEKPIVVSFSLMNKQFNLMLFVAWLVFNSESFELDFCPFFCCVFCIMSVTKIKDQNPLICKTFFVLFLFFTEPFMCLQLQTKPILLILNLFQPV